MKLKRKIVEINDDLCNGCGQCVPACAEGAMQIVDGKARLVADLYCDGLGACLGECPVGALKIIEREADDFDVDAVEEHIRRLDVAQTHKAPQQPAQAGCPSSRIQSFASPSPCEQANRLMNQAGVAAGLSHWPVQIRLVPPTAPFLRNAHLVVAADCVPVAYGDFHDAIRGKAVMIGCPKFDDVSEAAQKFVEVFQTADIKSITILDMEVPCCSKLPLIIKKALELTGRKIPLEEIVIGVRGDVLKHQKSAA